MGLGSFIPLLTNQSNIIQHLPDHVKIQLWEGCSNIAKGKCFICRKKIEWFSSKYIILSYDAKNVNTCEKPLRPTCIKFT
jgi:hypothetical protein